MVMWGSIYSCVKLGYEAFGINTSKVSEILMFAGTRFLVCGIIITAFSLIKGERLKELSKNTILPIIYMGIFAIVMHYAFMYMGMTITDKVKAFKVLKGEAIEIYATTLHFCPIQTSKDGFGCVVGLLKGTNTELDFVPENKLIFRNNKWIIAHEDNVGLIEKGVFGGIYGENHKIGEE